MAQVKHGYSVFMSKIPRLLEDNGGIIVGKANFLRLLGYAETSAAGLTFSPSLIQALDELQDINVLKYNYRLGTGTGRHTRFVAWNPHKHEGPVSLKTAAGRKLEACIEPKKPKKKKAPTPVAKTSDKTNEDEVEVAFNNFLAVLGKHLRKDIEADIRAEVEEEIKQKFEAEKEEKSLLQRIKGL